MYDVILNLVQNLLSIAFCHQNKLRINPIIRKIPKQVQDDTYNNKFIYIYY